MRRFLSTTCAVLAAVVIMMSSAGASRGWEWSEPVNIGSTINTPFDDSGPAVSKDGRVLYFQTNRPLGGANCDIWVAQRESVHHEWDWPERLDAVRPRYAKTRCRCLVMSTICTSRGPLATSGCRIGATCATQLAGASRCVSVRQSIRILLPRAPQDTSRVQNMGSRSSISSASDLTEWATPTFTLRTCSARRRVLVPGLNSPQVDAGAVLSRNGSEVFFHSTRPGTGGRDLWTSKRNSVFESWSPPANMAGVNSSAEDLFPALSSADDTLFFASTRPGGFGGTDIYVTTRSKPRKR